MIIEKKEEEVIDSRRKDYNQDFAAGETTCATFEEWKAKIKESVRAIELHGPNTRPG